MRIEGEYVAQIRFNFCEDVELPLDQIQDNFDKLADAICEILTDELMLGEQSIITVTKIQADIREVKE